MQRVVTDIRGTVKYRRRSLVTRRIGTRSQEGGAVHHGPMTFFAGGNFSWDLGRTGMESVWKNKISPVFRLESFRETVQFKQFPRNTNGTLTKTEHPFEGHKGNLNKFSRINTKQSTFPYHDSVKLQIIIGLYVWKLSY